jgi:hypothetical protein
MKTAAVIGLFALVVSTAIVGAAQRPRVSPHEIHEFDASGCHFTINYGRPSKKGRVIWGGLVPSGKWWMPGADEATIITTTKALAFDSVTMPAGEHTLYMWPDDKAPKLIISKEVGQFHTVYHPDRDLGRVDYVLTMIKEPVEQLTYLVEAQPGGPSTSLRPGGVLKLIWDDREYSAAFTVK